MIPAGVGSTISTNNVDGNDIGIYALGDGTTVSDNVLGATTPNRYEGIFADQGTTTISNNSVQGGNIGIAVVSFSGNTADTIAHISGGSVSNANTGVVVFTDHSGPNLFTAKASIIGVDVSDPIVTKGIDINGGTALIQGVTFGGTTIGLLVEGGAIVDAGQNGLLSPTDFTGFGISTGGNNFSSYPTPATSSSGAIVNLNTNVPNNLVGPQGSPYDTTALGNTFNGALVTVPQIKTVIWDDGDDSTVGFVAVNGAITFTGGTNFGAVEGSDSGTQTVANFSDTDLDLATDYTAVIHWGDGHDSVGVVTMTSPGNFMVQGNHTYAEENTLGYSISVTVTDGGEDTSSLTTAAATVADAQLINATGVNVSATEGALFSGSVATFTDPAGSEPIADYTATIDWGGAGTGSTTGTIVDDGSGQFHVTGGFTYAEEGSYTVQVTLTHDLLPSVLATSSTATVADAQLINATGVNVSATEGALFSGSVATFTDPAGSEPIADYTATIDWGARVRAARPARSWTTAAASST